MTIAAPPTSSSSESPRRRALITMAGASLALAGCGFQLRGQLKMPYDELAIQAARGSALAVELTRALRDNNTRVVDPASAPAVLHIADENRERRILTLGGTGRVREYQLRYRLNYRLVGRDAKEILPVNEILVRRELTYDDRQTLAKEQEEALLYRDMQSDAVQQILRRLQAVRVSSR